MTTKDGEILRCVAARPKKQAEEQSAAISLRMTKLECGQHEPAEAG